MMRRRIVSADMRGDRVKQIMEDYGQAILYAVVGNVLLGAVCLLIGYAAC